MTFGNIQITKYKTLKLKKKNPQKKTHQHKKEPQNKTNKQKKVRKVSYNVSFKWCLVTDQGHFCFRLGEVR